jgi:hypothetical protein
VIYIVIATDENVVYLVLLLLWLLMLSFLLVDCLGVVAAVVY